MIKRVDHLNIVVSDLEHARKFFMLLGFTAEPLAEVSGDWISEVVGLDKVKAEYRALSHPGSKVKIELIRYLSPEPDRLPAVSQANNIGLRHLAFAVDDIQVVVDTLKNAGVTFLSDIKTYPETGKQIIYFRGPDNIILERAQYQMS